MRGLIFPVTTFFVPCAEDFQNFNLTLVRKVSLVALACLFLSLSMLALAFTIALTLDGCINLVSLSRGVSYLKVPPPLSEFPGSVATLATAFPAPAVAKPLPIPVAVPPPLTPAVVVGSIVPPPLTPAVAKPLPIPVAVPPPLTPAVVVGSIVPPPLTPAVAKPLPIPVAVPPSPATALPASAAGAPPPNAYFLSTAVPYVVSAEAMLAQSKSGGSQEALPTFKDITFQTEFPETDWEKISEQELRNIPGFQSGFTLQLAMFFRGQGFFVNEWRIPAGVDVRGHEDIEKVRGALTKTFKEKREWFTRLFYFLARMGMAGYADQIRTFLAGHLDIRGKHESGASHISKKVGSPYPTDARSHEDTWTEAIRIGNQDYQKRCVPRRQSLETTDQQVQGYIGKQFKEWDLEVLGKNSAIRQLLLKNIKVPHRPSLEEGKDLLQKLTFLNSREGYAFCLYLQKLFPTQKGEFELIWEETVRLQQKSLGKEGEYVAQRRKANEMFQNQKRLYDAFGKGKIHPQFFQHFLSKDEMDKRITQLQRSNIISSHADREGYYTLQSEALWTIHLSIKDHNSEEARVAHVLQIAQGTMESRFTARRLAPTFYQSKVSNNNFDVPRDQLPILLAHEDFRVALVEMEKWLFMQFLGIAWDESRSQFIVTDQKKLQFITQQQSEDDVPLGSSVVSVFLDSVVSLGETKWASMFCTFLKQQQAARSIDTRYWDGAQRLHDSYVQATSQPGTSTSSAQMKNLPLLPAQELEYRNRRDTIFQLFAQGELLVRVIDLRELNDRDKGIYEGKWCLAYGPNLSTTLIPRQGSSLNMNLFLDGIRGVLLNPHSVKESYFGMGFTRNAVTQTDNFWSVLRQRKIGAPGVSGQLKGGPLSYVQQELARESAEVETGGRTPFRSHTEIAYFRPAERNLVQGLFFKVNDEKFTDSLRELIVLQKDVFDRFGFLLPIFAYKDLQLQEVVVDEQLLQALGIPNAPAVLRILDSEELERRKRCAAQAFSIYGDLDTAIVLAGKRAMLLPPAPQGEENHYENFHKLFDIQLMILQLKSPNEKISFMMKHAFRAEEFVSQQFSDYKGDKQQLIDALKVFDDRTDFADKDIIPIMCSQGSIRILSAQEKFYAYMSFLEKEMPTDLSILDNVHLIFPTISPTGNDCAEAQNLFFSHPGLIRLLRANDLLLRCWIQMAKRNMRMFLGIEIQTDKEGRITSININKNFLPVFRDSTDTTGKKQYAKCVSRVIQMLIILGKQDWIVPLITECRKQLGDDFGKEGEVDHFRDGSKSTETFMDQVVGNPNFSTPIPLPNPHGRRYSATLHIYATRMSPYAMKVVSVASSSKPAGVKQPPELQKNAAGVLNRVYQRTWQDLPSKAKKIRDGFVQRLLWMEGGAYTPEHAVDLTGSQIMELEGEGAFADTRANAESVRVVYRIASPSMITDFLVKTAVRSTNGDRDLLCPKDPSFLLTDEERRRKRYLMVKVGRVTFTAKGGYNRPRERLEKPVFVHVVSTAAHQFEKYGMTEELDVADFIVKQSAGDRTPLFPEWYEAGTIPSFERLQKNWEEREKQIQVAQFRGEKIPSDTVMAHEDNPASVQARCIRLRNGNFFLMGALRQSMYLYLKGLVLPAIRTVMVQTSPCSLYLKATAIGAGFFASLGIQRQFQTSLRKYIIEALIQSYVRLIQEDAFPKGSVIEFPYYKLDVIPPDLLKAASEKGVGIVWQENRDVCDFSLTTSVDGRQINPDTYTRFLLNPEDAFAFSGNESDSASVDAMVGNNSDLRMVFNWHFNHLLLDESRYVQV